MTDPATTLQQFYREKRADFVRHQASARLIEQYDANNAYQYIINREATQLSWIQAAIESAGGSVEEPEPDGDGGLVPATDAHTIVEQDARAAKEFVERWRAQVDAMTNARCRGMMHVILGEVREHQRSFEQALAGRVDLLGRRGREAGRLVGKVMPTRWIE